MSLEIRNNIKLHDFKINLKSMYLSIFDFFIEKQDYTVTDNQAKLIQQIYNNIENISSKSIGQGILEINPDKDMNTIGTTKFLFKLLGINISSHQWNLIFNNLEGGSNWYGCVMPDLTDDKLKDLESGDRARICKRNQGYPKNIYKSLSGCTEAVYKDVSICRPPSSSTDSTETPIEPPLSIQQSLGEFLLHNFDEPVHYPHYGRPIGREWFRETNRYYYDYRNRRHTERGFADGPPLLNMLANPIDIKRSFCQGELCGYNQVHTETTAIDMPHPLQIYLCIFLGQMLSSNFIPYLLLFIFLFDLIFSGVLVPARRSAVKRRVIIEEEKDRREMERRKKEEMLAKQEFERRQKQEEEKKRADIRQRFKEEEERKTRERIRIKRSRNARLKLRTRIRQVIHGLSSLNFWQQKSHSSKREKFREEKRNADLLGVRVKIIIISKKRGNRMKVIKTGTIVRQIKSKDTIEFPDKTTGTFFLGIDRKVPGRMFTKFGQDFRFIYESFKDLQSENENLVPSPLISDVTESSLSSSSERTPSSRHLLGNSDFDTNSDSLSTMLGEGRYNRRQLTVRPRRREYEALPSQETDEVGRKVEEEDFLPTSSSMSGVNLDNSRRRRVSAIPNAYTVPNEESHDEDDSREFIYNPIFDDKSRKSD